jgi:hypothetical protein
MSQLAPEPILRASMRVLYVAAYTTRNWTLSDDIPRKQINDLWEAIHEIPSLVTRWDAPEKCAGELKMYLREYDAKWPTPKLEAVFEQALRNADAGE